MSDLVCTACSAAAVAAGLLPPLWELGGIPPPPALQHPKTIKGKLAGISPPNSNIFNRSSRRQWLLFIPLAKKESRKRNGFVSKIILPSPYSLQKWKERKKKKNKSSLSEEWSSNNCLSSPGTRGGQHLPICLALSLPEIFFPYAAI